MATLTWLGHASFRLDTDGGKRIYIDPFFDGPTFPADEKDPDRADAVFVSHAHGDHLGSAATIYEKTGCKVLGIVETATWLSKNGVKYDDVIGFNNGGEAAGVVIRFDDTSIYFSGDTCVFGDMALIARIYKPDIVVLPIGDHYTMGPEEAAVALELLGNPRCVPCHWGTFPLLTGTPDQLAAISEALIEKIQPGDSVEV
jgi:L-ascorbate metabolism protein UlaG (beta-lactamase superfamily)